MPQFPANIDLSTLDGSTGFKLSGTAAGDRSGWSVAPAGDVNGDGFADVVVGAIFAAPNGSQSGAGYVVFGQASGFAANINLSSLDGTTGFKLSGAAAGDTSGWSVASAGDVNGDGFADVIVGAPNADPNGNSNSGASYVVFGQAAGFAANIELSSLDGSTGFRLSGASAGDSSGRAVASAGDVNGDGFDDLIVGASGNDSSFTNAGASYVVFGKASGFAANINLASLDGSTGFKLSGAASDDRSGNAVASAGDVNGDGFADVIVGAYYADPHGIASAGASYVVFGKASGFAANILLSSLDGTTGFALSGEAAGGRSGWSVASAGDVNGDGFDDLIVGALGSASCVVFGKASGFAANIDLSSLDGTTGFRLGGSTAAASAGDVNGDGFADLIVGSAYDSPHGASSGASYIVFGKASGFAANIDLSSVADGTTGFKLSGVAANDRAGSAAASAGDVNDDGFADLIVGARFASPNGGASGASYVVFGKLPDAAVNRTGTDATQTLAGGDFADTLSGLGGDDRLYGHGGNDALDGGTGDDIMIGGLGDDSYRVDSANDVVTETPGGGYDIVVATADYVMPANVEALFLKGTGLTGTGSVGDDILLSAASGGANTLIGLVGNDLYYVNHTGDTVVETAGGGTDIVVTTADYALPANVEALYLIGTGLTGTGSAGADTLFSGAGGGANTLVGLGGNDLYYVNHSGDTVTETVGGGYDTVVATADYTLPANVEAFYMNGSGLTGTGSGGADTLLSIGGANTLVGLGGDDLYYVSHSGDTVTETAGGGYDTVVATADYTLPANVEALYMNGSGLTGTGSGGADTLLSIGGANTLVGLGGNDVYYVNHSGDSVIETAGGGYDTVVATADYTMPANVEALYLIGTGLTGTGSGGADTLLSGAGGGANTLVGLGGDDLYCVNHSGDSVIETAGGGYDTVVATADYTMPANVEALYLVGTGLTGTGSGGADTLLSVAGGGANTLVGLGGDDLYYVSHSGDTVTETAGEGFDTVVATVNYTMPANVDALYVIGTGMTGTGSAGADTLITVGANTLAGAAGNDTFIFFSDHANGATVVDFDGLGAAHGDGLIFSGFGSAAQGATFTSLGGNTWQIHSGLDAHNETITLSNGASIHATDFLFV